MILDADIEEKIRERALELLKVGRTDWDERHTLTAVKWMRELIKGEGGNERVLIPAIYLHDVGYEELRKGYTHKECLEAKENHASRGARLAVEYLPKLHYFSHDEIAEIARLIKNHDIYDNVADDRNRQLILEADGLAQIDWYDCKPSYDKENTELFFKTTFTERIRHIRTETGKKILEELTHKAHQYLKEWK